MFCLKLLYLVLVICAERFNAVAVLCGQVSAVTVGDAERRPAIPIHRLFRVETWCARVDAVLLDIDSWSFHGYRHYRYIGRGHRSGPS